MVLQCGRGVAGEVTWFCSVGGGVGETTWFCSVGGGGGEAGEVT